MPPGPIHRQISTSPSNGHSCSTPARSFTLLSAHPEILVSAGIGHRAFQLPGVGSSQPKQREALICRALAGKSDGRYGYVTAII
jgi:hypothetical protein